MKKTYINGLGCVSAQNTVENPSFEALDWNPNQNVLAVKAPVYKDFIPPVAIRRMAKGVKNGIVASTLALREAQLETVDAIITGTGMGCIEDSEKFLSAILDNNEQFLTPTSFIQSTHNTVGGQIALGLQCKAYNVTYVNGFVSFESALLDAMLKIEEQEANAVLVGGIDEIAAYTLSLFKLTDVIKKEDQAPYSLLDSTTTGVVFGEGATFFALENKKTTTTYAEILGIEIYNTLAIDEVEAKIIAFLTFHNLSIENLDAVVMGCNGDVESDLYYKAISTTIFESTPQLYYKHLSGEYDTASAFGLWLAAQIVKTQAIPALAQMNTLEKNNYNTVLLYNQHNGIDHSFILLKKC